METSNDQKKWDPTVIKTKVLFKQQSRTLSKFKVIPSRRRHSHNTPRALNHWRDSRFTQTLLIRRHGIRPLLRRSSACLRGRPSRQCGVPARSTSTRLGSTQLGSAQLSWTGIPTWLAGRPACAARAGFPSLCGRRPAGPSAGYRGAAVCVRPVTARCPPRQQEDVRCAPGLVRTTGRLLAADGSVPNGKVSARVHN